MSPVPKIGEFFTENLVRDILYQFSGKTEASIFNIPCNVVQLYKNLLVNAIVKILFFTNI
jgi:predicted RNase H-like nuclease